jgi:hypothetical protein
LWWDECCSARAQCRRGEAGHSSLTNSVILPHIMPIAPAGQRSIPENITLGNYATRRASASVSVGPGPSGGAPAGGVAADDGVPAVAAAGRLQEEEGGLCNCICIGRGHCSGLCCGRRARR